MAITINAPDVVISLYVAEGQILPVEAFHINKIEISGKSTIIMRYLQLHGLQKIIHTGNTSIPDICSSTETLLSSLPVRVRKT